MSDRIRVFITDDHQIVRRGIRQLLSTEKGIEVVGEASNGREAIAGVEELKPDIVLMDLVMPVMDGIEAIRQIKAGKTSTQILVLTSFATDDKVFPAIKAGTFSRPAKSTVGSRLPCRATFSPTRARACDSSARQSTPTTSQPVFAMCS